MWRGGLAVIPLDKYINFVEKILLSVCTVLKLRVNLCPWLRKRSRADVEWCTGHNCSNCIASVSESSVPWWSSVALRFMSTTVCALPLDRTKLHQRASLTLVLCGAGPPWLQDNGDDSGVAGYTVVVFRRSCSKTKHVNGLKGRCWLGQNSTLIFGVIPFIKQQSDTHSETEKWDRS